VISLADSPYIVELESGDTAADDGNILLLGVTETKGLVLAARKLEWVPLEDILVKTALINYEPVEPEEVPDDAG
jgi:hypothetical protein